MARMMAHERFLLRVHAILDERDLHQKDLRGTNSEGWISNKLRGKRNLTLNEAEEIADAIPAPLSELVRRPDNQLFELDNVEVRLLEAFRQLTAPEQQAFLLTITLRQRPSPYNASKNNIKYGNNSRRLAATNVAPHLQSASLASATERELLDEFERRHRANPPTGSREQTPTTGGHRTGAPSAGGKVRRSSAK